MTGKVLFNHQQVKDPYAIYREQPAIYYDPVDKVWAVYNEAACTQILQHPDAIIPPVSLQGLNESALSLVAALARLSNAPTHAQNRAHTYTLFKQLQPPPVAAILDHLLHPGELDWVATVAKRLPAMMLLKGLGYSDQQTDTLVDILPALVPIMQAQKTPQQIAGINHAASIIHDGALAGLLIQSFDAGNGMLSNALLDQDPPIHHTRRMATADIMLDGHLIPKGATIIVVLAAARLPFGSGMHQCIATHFMQQLTTDTLAYLYNRFSSVTISETDITYAPLLNARIPQRIKIKLS